MSPTYRVLELCQKDEAIAQQLHRECQLIHQCITDIKEMHSPQRFDLCIIHGKQFCSEEQAILVIGHVKNLLSDHILFIAPSNHDYLANHYLSLGFVREKTSNESDVLRYSYNLETYNKKRDWNSPRFWANPENWLKRF